MNIFENGSSQRGGYSTDRSGVNVDSGRDFIYGPRFDVAVDREIRRGFLGIGRKFEYVGNITTTDPEGDCLPPPYNHVDMHGRSNGGGNGGDLLEPGLEASRQYGGSYAWNDVRDWSSPAKTIPIRYGAKVAIDIFLPVDGGGYKVDHVVFRGT
ncbi:hypothetical protein A2773_06745 [Candidatus Gottesmanbacteria bacterium RIFCSPHIGHO2_01_FULL_39_10]|uniref:Uncharacterized protein n=1 Tax=Candidatus Gottesmanbacteria bacterium RIFCSPHIGHO2_01_FULL_39_10 TaxID=1798375 RepID=A0A1F5ZQ98_9BACT|nr:MAG: hypothetical protein A2773_06745 [Candidatus Gottesmanbacteria bacterium RIFCSPHIGHO2_01_FULL_39_10]